LTLSSIHKSKGREWRRVFWLGMAAFQPSKYARKDWQIVQERNLQYVAGTRAMAELVHVHVTGNSEAK
jgi:superfamily I DNA/RNA helicase